MIRFWLLTLSALFLLAPSAAEARKVALVIGNGDHANTSRLANPATSFSCALTPARAFPRDRAKSFRSSAAKAGSWTGISPSNSR